MSTPSPSDRVFNDPRLLREIVNNLNDGEARDLVTCLQVSNAFFHASAGNLCRRIEVPQYEFSSNKTRDEVLYAKPCASCYGDEPAHYQKPKNVTAHRALHPELSKQYLKNVHLFYRSLHPATTWMKEMYKHVHVVIIEEHDGCDRLATLHPLPFVRTVIARGGHKKVCTPSQAGQTCGFIPRNKFRLILDGTCGGVICKSCTSFRLLTPAIETLVVRLRYYLNTLSCEPVNLPQDVRPARLVLLFPPESIKDTLEELNQASSYQTTQLPVTDGDHLKIIPPPAPGPRTGKKRGISNTFYRMAKLCLAMDDDCKIYIVGADQGALHFREFETQDADLKAFEPLFPHACGPNENSWVFAHEKNTSKPITDTEGSTSTYACYDQSGRLVSAVGLREPIPPQHQREAEKLIAKRLAVMENVLHKWIDYILDSRNPLAHWEDEKDSGKWKDRDSFERHLRRLKAEKAYKEETAWHNDENHQCGYVCRSFSPDIPESVDGEGMLERHDQEDDHWGRRGPFDFSDPVFRERERLRREEYDIENSPGYKRPVKVRDPEETSSRSGKRVKYQRTREEIKERKRLNHLNIRFITTHEYHLMEGNKDEMDDPSRYL